MKKAIALSCGSALAIATGAYFFLRAKANLNFQRLKVLDKDSLLYLLKQIRKEFTDQFLIVLRLNRDRRRCLHKNSREYRRLITVLKEEVKDYIQKSVEITLEKNDISEEVLIESYKHFEEDLDIKSAISKVCSVETNKVSSLIIRKLEEILKFYIARVQEFQEEDPNELNIKMKILEDEIYDEFGCEPEEIEAAVNRNQNGIEDLVATIKEMNKLLLEKTNQELFF